MKSVGFLKTNNVIGPIKPFSVNFQSLTIGEPMVKRYSFVMKLLDKKLEAYYNTISFPKQKTVCEGIFALLTHQEFAMGPISYIRNAKKVVYSHINYAIKHKKPVVFCLLGLPHKMPNILLTDEKEAGGAEYAMLVRFKFFTSAIEKIYPPGAQIHIFTEEYVLGHLSNLSKNELDMYIASIQQMITMLGLRNKVILKELGDYEEQFPRFTEIYMKNISYYKKNDQKTVEKVRPNFFWTTNTRHMAIKDILQIFDFSKKTEDLYTLLKYYRINWWEQTYLLAIQYLAYHKTRKDIHFMDKIAPHSIRLTVAPKPGSVGLHIISKTSEVLPYYGYLVFDKGTIDIVYKLDIIGNPNKYIGYADTHGKIWFYERKM